MPGSIVNQIKLTSKFLSILLGITEIKKNICLQQESNKTLTILAPSGKGARRGKQSKLCIEPHCGMEMPILRYKLKILRKHKKNNINKTFL